MGRESVSSLVSLCRSFCAPLLGRVTGHRALSVAARGMRRPVRASPGPGFRLHPEEGAQALDS